MSLIRTYLSKFYFKIDAVEIKRNFINLPVKKTIIMKNPYYEFLKNKPNLKTSVKKISSEEKKLYRRNGREYNIMLKKLKKSFKYHVEKIKFYENYNYKEKKFMENLTINKKRIIILKKLLKAYLGLLVFFKTRIVKLLNYSLLFFLIFYFDFDEDFFSYFLNPKIESNLYEIDNFAYVPDKYNFRKLIKENAPANSLAKKTKLGEANRLNAFRESFEFKDEIKEYIEKRLLKYERLKILIMGTNYKVESKNYEPKEIFDSIERKKQYYFLSDYWKESFILRRINDFYRASAWILRKIKKLFLGDKTLTYWIMKNIDLESYYFYRHLTLNERIRYRIDSIRSFEQLQKALDYLDRRYTPVCKKYLKLTILSFLDDKDYREKLFDWLTTFLFIKIEFTDFLLEKICSFLIRWIDSSGLDNVI